MNTSPIFCATCGAANPPDAALCFACGNPSLVAAHAPSTSSTGLLAPQSLLKQRYRRLWQIGTGGFGAVYQAEDTELGNRKVAVKEMSQRGLTPEELQEAAQAFRNEALLLAGLTHPNLPRIYEQFSENGRWYLVMDFIEGETLEARIDRVPGGLLPVQEVVRIGLQLCTVLEYLHTRQPPIIFRDLKPANIMVTPSGDIYLIDFGIARHFKPGQTRDTVAFGSAGYAAPEQYGKAQTTTQSDIYSLGATLHQLLSGADPADNPFLFEPLHLAEPVGLDKLIRQMLEQDTRKRPHDIHAIGQELQRISDTLAAQSKVVPASLTPSAHRMLAGSSTSHVPTNGVAAQSAAAPPGVMMTPALTQRGLSKGDRIGLGIAGGVIGLILIVALVAWSLSFHQAVVTSQAVPYIQVGTSADFSPATSGSDTFHVGDMVYVTFILGDTSLPSVPVKLFLGTALKQADTVSTGETLDLGGSSGSFSIGIFNTPNGTVTGVQVTDSTTITQTGIYKWEVDDEQGNAVASITFQVIS
ncbi:MAG TPA: serine/threonine-protein kinase [Ktedonobacterales bacterium]|nr:serine/threonine-protein kinase [Ktedonobacterales bacterium]